ncbi:MAG: hypothetical protein KAX49_08525 [Halanaerobiales bacterium]|nr:hypothetical protein [Halanaerobiales bacterium]
MKNFLTNCSLKYQFTDEDELIQFISLFELVKREMPTSAKVNFKESIFTIVGIGDDGRCSFCRYLRKCSKEMNLLLEKSCPYERIDSDYKEKVYIGDRVFDLQLFEDERKYLEFSKRVAERKNDLEAHFYLGLINEYFGDYLRALEEYYEVLCLNPKNEFCIRRFNDLKKQNICAKIK